MTYGSKPDGSSWNVAVTDPRAENDDDYLGVVALNGTEFLSTSGDYEIFYRRWCKVSPHYGSVHRLSGKKRSDRVTVVCDTGLEADALSTACFVLGGGKRCRTVENLRCGRTLCG